MRKAVKQKICELINYNITDYSIRFFVVVNARVSYHLGKNCKLLFHLKKNTSRRVIYALKEKKKVLGNINFGDYAKKGRDLIEDVELKLENKNKDL